MIVKVYSVYDSKAKTWEQPQFVVNKGAAARSWYDLVNQQNTQYNKHPEDYTLYEIGQWDDQAGIVTTYEKKESLGIAIEHVKDEQK
jgi:hypothetical protein